MTIAFLLRPGAHGPRAHPIKVDEAQALVKRGLARLLRPKVYEEIVPDPTYETKVMTPRRKKSIEDLL